MNMCWSLVGAVSLAAVGEGVVFTSLSRKVQPPNPVKWGEQNQQRFLLTPAVCWLQLLRADAHVSGDTCWDAFVSPSDEPAQEFFSWRADFVAREMSGMALKRS